MRGKARSLRKNIVWAVILIPLQSADKWQIDKYSRIAANEVKFSPAGLEVKVKESANPMMYPLPSQSKVSGFRIKGEFRGLPKFSDPGRQGEKGFDDFPLRIGLILPGEKTLGGIKKMFAPEWVKNLYSKIPEGLGLDHVHFYNITQNSSQVGKARVHPASDLIQEDFIDKVAAPGPFQFEYKLPKATEALALWLSIDGDDTRSEYSVLISQFEIDTL